MEDLRRMLEHLAGVNQGEDAASAETEMNRGQVSHSPLLFPGTALLSVLMPDHESGGSAPRGGLYGSPNFPLPGQGPDNVGFVEVILLFKTET